MYGGNTINITVLHSISTLHSVKYAKVRRPNHHHHLRIIIGLLGFVPLRLQYIVLLESQRMSTRHYQHHNIISSSSPHCTLCDLTTLVLLLLLLFLSTHRTHKLKNYNIYRGTIPPEPTHSQNGDEKFRKNQKCSEREMNSIWNPNTPLYFCYSSDTILYIHWIWPSN